MITREVDNFSTKEEDNTNDHNKISKPSASSSTSWSRLKDPRIVRVSRAFGGKDRHSKVCTVRGLRDRRVRLSVPTAIQLYDLQDRLGLNQPSKVVDWLLNAAKHEIDGLPPLQMPPGNFPPNLHPMFGIGNSSQTDKGLLITGSDETMRESSKDVDQETTNEKDQDCDLDHNHHQGGYVSSNNFFHRSSPNQNQNHTSLAGLMNNNMSYSSFLRWDPSNLSLSHGGSHGLPPHPEEFRNFNMVSGSSSPQVVVYPHGVVQSYFPSNISATEFDSKHINSQMLTSNSQNPGDSSSQPVRPFHFSMMANHLPSHNNDGNEGNKDDHDFDSR